MGQSRNPCHSIFLIVRSKKRRKVIAYFTNCQTFGRLFVVFYLIFCYFVKYRLSLQPIYMRNMANNLKYADAMKELEQIVSKLQNPNCDVDELCSLTAKAIELLNFCKAKLTKVDEDLVKLLENIE